MDNIVKLIKENERIFLENALELNDVEMEQEDIDGYFAIQGATEDELKAFENQFQIELPEDFKAVYRYKNGSGYMSLIWPQEGFCILRCSGHYGSAEADGSSYRGFNIIPTRRF